MYTNKLNKKKYIGQTINLKTRISCHKTSKRNDPFHNAIRKYGFDNFEMSILEHINGTDKKSIKKKLNELEISYISKYGTKYPAGYNLTNGGEGSIDRKFTNDHRQKISEALKGRKLSEEHKMKLHRKRSPETCKKIGLSKKGQIPWNKGVNTKPDVIEKQVKSRRWFYDQGGPNKGKSMSDEQKLKLSKAHKGKKLSNESKEKIAKYNREHPEKYDALRNKPLSEERRKKISEALKGVANTRGKIWVTNGVTNKLINPNELENYKKNGFYRGRKI